MAYRLKPNWRLETKSIKNDLKIPSKQLEHIIANKMRKYFNSRNQIISTLSKAFSTIKLQVNQVNIKLNAYYWFDVSYQIAMKLYFYETSRTASDCRFETVA